MERGLAGGGFRLRSGSIPHADGDHTSPVYFPHLERARDQKALCGAHGDRRFRDAGARAQARCQRLDPPPRFAIVVVGGARSLLMTTRGGIPASCNAAAARACQPGRMPLRCLLVDDSDEFLRAASALLEREGVTVAGMASNSAEALRQARVLRPDVILVDIGLGDENGFDLARLLAQDGHGGQTAVIMISARAEADYTELIAESQAVGFLAKSELSAREIGRILGPTP